MKLKALNPGAKDFLTMRVRLPISGKMFLTIVGSFSLLWFPYGSIIFVVIAAMAVSLFNITCKNASLENRLNISATLDTNLSGKIMTEPHIVTLSLLKKDGLPHPISDAFRLEPGQFEFVKDRSLSKAWVVKGSETNPMALKYGSFWDRLHGESKKEYLERSPHRCHGAYRSRKFKNRYPE